MNGDEFWRETSEGLRAAVAEWRGIEAPPAVEARLIAAFRERNGISAPSAARWRIPWLTWLPTAAAMAALALVLVHGGNPGGRGSLAALAGDRLASARLPAVVLNEDAPGAGGDFIALPNAGEISPGEELNLVWLEVPRSRLLALGFLVNADRASDTVEADVVMGADGLARAVRFVE